jgi:hypothetical protein
LPQTHHHFQLFKVKKKKKTNNRGLSVRSRGAAAYEKAGYNRTSSFIENNGGFDENMNGGRKGRGTAGSLTMLAIAWDLVPDLVVPATDVAKCFPSADRDVGMLELAELGVWGDAWNLVASLDEGLHGRVIIGGVLSAQYPVNQGWLEGDTNCPLKCNALVQPVLVALRLSGLGVVLYGVWIGGSSFLDDLLMIARGMPMAQAMMNVARRVLRDLVIGISAPKSVFVRRRPVAFANATLTLKGMVGGGVTVVGPDTVDMGGAAQVTGKKGGGRGKGSSSGSTGGKRSGGRGGGKGKGKGNRGDKVAEAAAAVAAAKAAVAAAGSAVTARHAAWLSDIVVAGAPGAAAAAVAVAVRAAESAILAANMPLGWQGVPEQAVECAARNAALNRTGVTGEAIRKGGRRNTGSASDVARAELERVYTDHNPGRLSDGTIEGVVRQCAQGGARQR